MLSFNSINVLVGSHIGFKNKENHLWINGPLLCSSLLFLRLIFSKWFRGQTKFHIFNNYFQKCVRFQNAWIVFRLKHGLVLICVGGGRIENYIINIVGWSFPNQIKHLTKEKSSKLTLEPTVSQKIVL